MRVPANAPEYVPSHWEVAEAARRGLSVQGLWRAFAAENQHADEEYRRALDGKDGEE